MDYLDFDLYFSSTADGYRVRATNAQGANVVSDFTFPFNGLEIENLVLKVGRARKNRNSGRGSADMQAAVAFGSKLFGTIFAGEILAVWRSSWANLGLGHGLRLRLFLTDTPDLLDL